MNGLPRDIDDLPWEERRALLEQYAPHWFERFERTRRDMDPPPPKAQKDAERYAGTFEDRVAQMVLNTFGSMGIRSLPSGFLPSLHDNVKSLYLLAWQDCQTELTITAGFESDRRMNRMVTELVRSVAAEEPPEAGAIRMMGASLGSDLSNLHNDEDEDREGAP